MNGLLEAKHSMNLSYYREQIFSSVHVGDFVTSIGAPQVSGQASLPSVAVIVPVFNTNPQFLKEAIDSIVVTQTYKGPITIIIVNDGSTNPRTNQYLDDV